MKNLQMLLQSICTFGDPEREDAMVELSSAISINSETVLKDFISKWLLTTEYDLAKMSTEDKAYRQFIVDFEEKYNG